MTSSPLLHLASQHQGRHGAPALSSETARIGELECVTPCPADPMAVLYLDTSAYDEAAREQDKIERGNLKRVGML